MADISPTITVIQPSGLHGGRAGDKVEFVMTFAGNAAHLAAGDGFTAALAGFSSIDVLIFEELWLTSTTSQTVEWDRANGLLYFWTVDKAADTDTIVGNGDQSANTYRAFGVGTLKALND